MRKLLILTMAMGLPLLAQLHLLQEGTEERHGDFALFAQLTAQQRQEVERAAREAADRARASSDSRREESFYRRGSSALDSREWDKAVEAFTEAAKLKGVRADGALYWKSYALRRLGRRDEALATLAELQQTHSASRWLNDAKVLEMEVRQSAGQPVSPEQESNEELKLYALNSLVHTEPARALPLLEKILQSASSPQLKERALFVLTQIRAPEGQSSPALPVLVRLGKGDTNPDLQRKAVLYLGEIAERDKSVVGPLSEIYSASPDLTIKRSVLRGYAQAKDKDRLLAVAASESNQQLRRDAIHQLASIRASDELWKLYGNTSDIDTKMLILGAAGRPSLDRLLEIARRETDAKIRALAIAKLGEHRSPQVVEALVSVYDSQNDENLRKAIIRSLYGQRNAEALVGLARKENDAELKKQIVRYLSQMKSKEAADYLMELISK